jgi:NAD-dependent SIR2 family protein deacetylase
VSVGRDLGRRRDVSPPFVLAALCIAYCALSQLSSGPMCAMCRSVASGIPDFRSADGLYATLNPDLLTADAIEREAIRSDPTFALEQTLFTKNPLPCLELNREFILGTREQRWKSTLAHRFVELLHSKTGKLVRLYTQNIDGLEDQCTELPREKVVAVHGSMDRAECAMCKTESDFNAFAEKVRRQIKDLSSQDPAAPATSTPIDCDMCGAQSMKPAIVLFKSSLPMEFFEKVPEDIEDVDLLIVIGTSLRVAPANSLVWRVPKSAMRLLVNREEVGWHLGMNFGENADRDIFAEGTCENVLLELMDHLGWLDDLAPLVSGDKLPESSAHLLRERLARVDASTGDRSE